MRVGIEVALAEFDKTSERLQAVNGADHGFAAQRVQHHIDALTAGIRGNLVGESQGAGITNEVGADIAQKRPLFFTADGDDDNCTEKLGDLQSGETNCACAAMDENGLTAA